jgi:AcrR family transcriptional regulator
MNMGAPKLAYHHGDLRSALLAAALEIIADSGPQGLSIREAARRVGVSHAAPYRHFADKDELIVAVVEQGFDLLNQTMQRERIAAGADPLDQFAAGGRAYVTFAMEYPGYYRVMFSGDLLNTSGQESLKHTSSAAFEQIVADLKTCQRLGIVRTGDPLLQAVAMVSSVHGYVTLANDNRIGHLIEERYSIEQVTEFVMSAFFDGLGAH